MEGTISQRRAADFRAIARDKLAGNWWLAVGVCLVAVILGGAASGFQFRTSIDTDLPYFLHDLRDRVQYSLPAALAGLLFFTSSIAAVASIGRVLGLVSFFIGGTIELGLRVFFIDMMKNRRLEFKTLFSKFEIWGKALGLRLFINLFISLWTLLLIVPGLVALYRYSMATYLMAENPALGIREAVNMSKQMMQGQKGRLFCLDLSFAGWWLLTLFTLGLGSVFLTPYHQAARAAFYMELSGQPILAPEAGGFAGGTTERI